jgi:putative nucleotidyltransferase with HDIG domain
MGKVNIDALKPGMVLAEDLKHSNGRFLLGKGAVLEPTHLRVFKIWGVVSAEIEGVSDDFRLSTLDEIDPAVLEAAEKLTQKRFSLSNSDHPFLQALSRICTLRQAQQMVLKETREDDWTSAGLGKDPTSQSTSIPSSSRSKKDLSSLVDENVNLPSLPHIFTEISRVINDPRSSAIHVANVISKDPNLSAKLLKIVNSAFYSFPTKIDTISRAVMIVGSKQLSTLALGTSVINVFQDIPADLVDMKSFWKHSIACGISARMIASYKNVSNTERLFVAGLLHDIGRLIIYKHFPREGREILLQARRTNCLLRSAEFEILGFDHTQIGGMLLKKWKLPLMLEHAVGNHHQPSKSQYLLEATIVCVADILINALRIGTSGEHLVPPIIPEVWSELGLPIEIFTKIIQLIDRQVEEVTHNFFDGG